MPQPQSLQNLLLEQQLNAEQGNWNQGEIQNSGSSLMDGFGRLRGEPKSLLTLLAEQTDLPPHMNIHRPEALNTLNRMYDTPEVRERVRRVMVSELDPMQQKQVGDIELPTPHSQR